MPQCLSFQWPALILLQRCLVHLQAISETFAGAKNAEQEESHVNHHDAYTRENRRDAGQEHACLFDQATTRISLDFKNSSIRLSSKWGQGIRRFKLKPFYSGGP